MKIFHGLLNPPAFKKSNLGIVLVFSSPIGHWEQNDISELGHHIWAQPAPQTKVIRQRIFRAKLSQS